MKRTPNEPTSLDLFAAVHEQRAKGKSKSRVNAKRDYRLIALPDRVMNPRRTITMEYPFSRLAIDQLSPEAGGYQRAEIKPWVNDLKDLLRRGGVIPAIHVVSREWEKGDVLWIVDGQQRYWASWDTETPLTCLVHHCESYQEEKDLFAVLNDRRRLSSNYVIHNHEGHSSKLLIEADTDPTHPFYKRIHFGPGASGGRVAAGSLLTACARFCGGIHGSVMSNMSTVDRYATSGGKQSLVEFIRLLGTIYASPKRPTGENLYAIGRGLAEAGVTLPLPKPIVTKLKNLKLESVKASTKQERVLLMARRVTKAVKGPEAV